MYGKGSVAMLGEVAGTDCYHIVDVVCVASPMRRRVEGDELQNLPRSSDAEFNAYYLAIERRQYKLKLIAGSTFIVNRREPIGPLLPPYLKPLNERHIETIDCLGAGKGRSLMPLLESEIGKEAEARLDDVTSVSQGRGA